MTAIFRPVDTDAAVASAAISETTAFQNVNGIAATQPANVNLPFVGPMPAQPMPANGPYRRVFKRALDFVLAVLLLPIVAPVVGLLAALIAMDGHNPFYSQMRVGRDGKSFRMWKLRTMVPNADTLLESYLGKNPEARAEWDKSQKLKNDPRITWVGRLLRKTSLDELGQLINVLNGTMSLVGPRPIMECQREAYKGTSYSNMTPGITGLWQVSDRNECEFTGRVYYDDLYDKTLSFRTDLTVLFRTVGVVVRATGY